MRPLLPSTSYPCASLPVFLCGFHPHWRHAHLIHKADKIEVCVCVCVCGLWPDSWHMNTAHICVSICLQMAPPLISRQPENDLDSPGWMCLHTYWWHCQSESIALTSEERDVLTVTKAPVYLPSWWNTLQSHRSLLSSVPIHDGVNGYWSFWLADSQHILLDIFIFALNHKLPSIIRLHKGFRYEKRVTISLLSIVMNIQKRSSPCSPPELSIPRDSVLNNLSLIPLLFQCLFLPQL